jgi:hypothetical protein
VSGINTAGIHYSERTVIPFGLGYDAIARGTGGIIHDGETFPCQTVEECTFSYIGASD